MKNINEGMPVFEHEDNRERFPAPVYYVESEADETVLVGMDVQLKGDFLTWFDTVKDRTMLVDRILEESSKEFVFKRNDQEGGGIYTFQPMTLEVYNSSVRERLINGETFSDTEAMIKAFLETQNDAW